MVHQKIALLGYRQTHPNKKEHKEGFKLLKILDRAFNDAEFKQRYITAGIMNEDYKPFYVIRKVENPKIPVRYSYGSINFPKFHECSFKLMNEGTHMLEIN